MRTATVSKQTLYIFEGTFRHAQAGFIIDRQARGLAKGTIKYYMDELDRFAEFQDLIGVLTIEEVTADVIRKY
ncbi:MAG: hypothetical protein M1281_06770, partial [Chloroflexi bacterium]|nr:hypothetical protein [Chloroflexota bacterium]